jgi:EAL domain-containing protein (putative c-di-GMP-specific phosphodiesterase class I)
MESEAANYLQRLVDAGIRLALDGFGTGYSSLLRARYYPVDVIKIDQAFAPGITEPIDDVLRCVLWVGT